MVAPSVDLLALLRPSQVVVRVGGHSFILQATTAAQWLGAIATDPEHLRGIMPGLIADDDLDPMLDLMAMHPDIEDRWDNAGRVALGRAAGRDWWWAARLSRRALGIWSYVNGILLRQNINAQQISYPDWLDACYSMLWQGADEENRIKLDMQLSAKPRGIAVRQSKQARDQMIADFRAD